MVVKILAADAVAVSVRIVAPAEDTRIGNIVREEIAEPVDAVRGGPSFVLMSVQAMNGHNTSISQRSYRSGYALAYSTMGQSPSATIFRPWGVMLRCFSSFL